MATSSIGHSAETKASLESRLQDKHHELSTEGGGGAAHHPKIDLSIVVAFGSDGGNGMSLAEKIARKAEVRHVREVRDASHLSLPTLIMCSISKVFRFMKLVSSISACDLELNSMCGIFVL
jgi:hypothetical protein